MRYLILFLGVFLLSCDNMQFTRITDFTRPTQLVLKTPGKNYATYHFRIRGTVNDTVKLGTNISAHVIPLSGAIDREFIFDFYGSSDSIVLTFDPYKAKTGHIEIAHSAD